MIFRPLVEKDWEQVSRIYLEGIQTGNATFQLDIPNWNDWNSSHLKSCRIVAESNGKVVGWSALSYVSNRCVYQGVAEVSVYVSMNSAGKQIGTKLLEKLIIESERNGIWTLQSGIFSENEASLRIHEKVGFRKVGYRERIGQIRGVWKDNIILERRSNKVGN